MNTVESFALSFLFNSLWQIPLLFGAGWLAARLLRPTGPVAEHRAWVATLLLSVLLPALSSLPIDRLPLAWHWLTASHPPANGGISIQMGPATPLPGVSLPSSLLTALFILYLAAASYFLARFIWRCTRLPQFYRDRTSIALTGDAAATWEQTKRTLAIGEVALASSSRIFAPVTLGLVRPLILLPAGMQSRLAGPDFEMIVAHEFAHVRRHDFLKNLFYEMLSLPVSYHPLFRLTRQYVMESREIVCDRMAARISGDHQYTQSLLRLAALLVQRPVPVPHVIGVFDAHTLERRLMRLTQNGTQPGRIRRLTLIASCIALGAITCTSALALHLTIDPGVAISDDHPGDAPPVPVPAGVMAGNLTHKVTPVYPAEAKSGRIQGTVKLDALIGKDGRVENLKVISGPAELQQSSLDAVRQWTYKPYLQDGEPTEVKTTINIIFSLAR